MRLMMADQPRYYVSLGDSMCIDDYAGGEGRGAASLLYQNRDNDFPEWGGRDLVTCLPNCRLVAMAADGATSAAVRFAQIPRVKEMGIRPDIVTLTMGGNDLLQTFGSDDAARAALEAFRENGHVVLEKLRSMCAPETPIVLGTIYDPSDGTGDTQRLAIPLWPSALHWLRAFNEAIHALAEEHAVLLADIHAAFQGHGLHTGNPANDIARPSDRNLYYCGVVEPNAWGASAIRRVWWETLYHTGFMKEPAP